MKKKQSLVCGFLAVILAMSFGACSAKVQRLTGTDSFKFTGINNGTAYSVSKGTAIEGEVNIPAFYRPSSEEKYLPVTAIANNAFSDCDRLTKVTIPTGVTAIGNNAFTDCTSLTNINIPAGVTTIGSSAFFVCTSLTSVTIPESVTSIGRSAFFGCASLTSITIPASVTTIEAGAFGNCTGLTGITVDSGNPNYSSDEGILYNKAKTLLVQAPGKITSISISANVTSIGESSLEDCENLTSITVDSGNPNFSSEGGVLYNKAKTEIIFVPRGITSVTIPESVTSIGGHAFFGSSLANITIPESVRSIGYEAFIYSGLSSITIPGSIRAIEDRVFLGSYMLTSVTIQEGITSIGEGAFAYCQNLTSIDLPASLRSIGDHAFAWSNRLSITIPATVRSIGNEAFYGWNASQIINIRLSYWTAQVNYGRWWYQECDATINYAQ